MDTLYLCFAVFFAQMATTSGTHEYSVHLLLYKVGKSKSQNQSWVIFHPQIKRRNFLFFFFSLF